MPAWAPRGSNLLNVRRSRDRPCGCYPSPLSAAISDEVSLIDPLPHQRLAVYGPMLSERPLRFLLADDAGAGKTIMTGLYIREMLSVGCSVGSSWSSSFLRPG